MILLVVVLHAGIVYESILENSWIVSDTDKSNSIGLIRMYLDLFIMFVIFFISGYFIPESLKRKSNLEFLRSKFKRIMLPWIIAVLTLIPAYKAIFLYSRGLPQEEWYSYFHFFKRAGTDLYFYANNPTQNWLWFLPALFLFQVVYLVMHRTKILKVNITLKTGIVLTLVFGVLYSMLISTTGLKGWYHSYIMDFQRERLPIYFLVFLLGSLSNKLNALAPGKKERKLYILSNVALTISLGVYTAVALNLFFNLVDPGRNYYFISSFMDRVIYYTTALLSMFSFLHILIYAFRSYINKENRIMAQLNRSSYQVYIVHVPVLGVIALTMVGFPLPGMVKFLILAALTFTMSNLLVLAYRKVFKQNTYLKAGALGVFAVVFFILTQSDISLSAASDHRSSGSGTSSSVPSMDLHEATLKGELEVVLQHIEAGSDLNTKDQGAGSSPLITAAAFGKTEVAIALIEAGADINFKNNEGSTPLHAAAFFCRQEIVEALLANGADPSLRNNSGSTALESVSLPFEKVESIYEYFSETLGPLGLELDFDEIRSSRPRIAEMLAAVTAE